MSSEGGVYDVIVIGGGAVGENAALYATQYSGLSAVIVESSLLGGACSYWACMPSKALLRPLAVAREANRVPGVARTHVSTIAVLAHRDDVVHHHDDSGQVAWAAQAGIDVVRGWGCLTGNRRVSVNAAEGVVELVARHAVVLATGSVPSLPNIPGLREAEAWTSDDATNLHQIPGSIAIFGGGVVACEAATWLSGLGADVTLFELGDRVLPRHEPRASAMVQQGLADRGVDVRTRTSPRAVNRGQEVELDLGEDGKMWVDEILVATGRQPRRDSLGLEDLGLSVSTWQVDPTMRLASGGGWLYAVGDINGGTTMLTHMGKYQARVAGEDIAARFGARHDDPWAPGPPPREPVVPSVVFTDPEVATVGLTAQEARLRGHDTIAVEYDTGSVAGATLLDPDFQGWAHLVLDRLDRRVLGATFVGLGAAELLHSATFAVTSGIDVTHLWHAVPSYPTVSEVWLRLLETLRQQTCPTNL